MTSWLEASVCLFIILAPPISSQDSKASSGVQTYWNTDGAFAQTYQTSFNYHSLNSSIFTAPWGANGWGVFAFGDFPSGTRGSADEYAFNASQGILHSWVREDRRILGSRTGVVGIDQGVTSLGGGFSPNLTGVLGRDTILAYKIRRENTSISQSLSSGDEDGLLFDLLLVGNYAVNGTVLTPTLIVDFYVNQECGPLNGGCSQNNDTTVNHHVKGHTHYFEWRIHNNIQNGVWVSDVVNLRWYLENSAHRAFCWEATGSGSCSLPPIDVSLYGLTATAEAFGGSSGFALAYADLLQANDCGTGQDAGHDINHPLAIANFTRGIYFSLVEGWLGIGSHYEDADDYYRFNVSQRSIASGGSISGGFGGADYVSFYAPGNPPPLRIIFDNRTLGFTYNFSITDSAGDWYLRVHKSVGFGFYWFKLGVDVSSPRIGSLMASCSAVSPSIAAHWEFVFGAGVITLLVVAGGRYRSRRWQPAH